ncbi:MAG: hypothetical protein ABIP11_01740 [Luteimonas sp.]
MRALLERTGGSAGSSSDAAVISGEVLPAIGVLPPDPTPASDAPPLAEVGGQPQIPMVYRCVGRHGAVSLQSQPCAAGQRTTRAMFAAPEAERQPRQGDVASSAPSVAAYSYPAAAVDDVRDRRRRECANARSNREATLANVGLARTYDLLQRLDGMVQEACKGL